MYRSRSDPYGLMMTNKLFVSWSEDRTMVPARCQLCGVPEGGTGRWYYMEDIACYCCANAGGAQNAATCSCLHHSAARKKATGTRDLTTELFADTVGAGHRSYK